MSLARVPGKPHLTLGGEGGAKRGTLVPTRLGP